MRTPRSLASLPIAAVVALAAAATAPAQQARPAPAAVRDALHVRAAWVFDARLPASAPRGLRLRLPLGPASYRVELRPHDLRSRDFRLLVDRGDRLEQVPTPPSVTYRGEILDRPGGEVAASLIDGRLTAAVRLARGGVWQVQPLAEALPGAPRTRHVVYRAADVAWPHPLRCANAERALPESLRRGGSGGAPAAMKEAEIAIDADLEYYQKNGSDVVRTQNRVTTIMNAVDAIYRRDVEIQYRITTIVVRTKRTYNPPLFGFLPFLLLDYQRYWNQNHGNVPRDVAHLFTGKGQFSGIIGVSLLGQVCNLSTAYGVSKAFSPTASLNVALVAHELGHSWGAIHCSGSTCNIMCANLNGTGCSGKFDSFGPLSKFSIVTFKNSRTCLSDPGGNQPRITPFGTGCKGSRGTPAIGAIGLPRLGQSYSITLAGGVPGGRALLLGGADKQVPPFDLSWLGAPGCSLLVKAQGFFFVALDGQGGVVVRDQVPNDPRLLGKSIYVQWVTIDAAANRLGLAFSRGLQITVGR